MINPDPPTPRPGAGQTDASTPPQPFYEEERGQIRLYLGDALQLLEICKPESFDLIFADPPYFLSNGGITCQAGKMVSVNKGMWDKAETFEEVHAFNCRWLEACRRVLKPDGAIWISGTSHNIHSVGYAMQTLGYKILNDIAWYKVNPPPNLSCRYFVHSTETVLWARKSPKSRHTFNYALMKEANGDRQMQSLWHIKPPGPNEKRYGKHPTQKPEALLERIVLASTNPGDLVLDPFCGSGTTGVACVRHGRGFVGFEMEGEFVRLAITRLSDALHDRPVTVCFVSYANPLESSQTWARLVYGAIRDLGGDATLKDINAKLARNPRTRTNRTWPCTVRRVVRQCGWFEPVARGRYCIKQPPDDVSKR